MTTPDGRTMESSEFLGTAEKIRATDAQGQPVIPDIDTLANTDDTQHPRPYRKSGFAVAGNPPPKPPLEQEFTD